jgi:hypothetical protein
MIDLDVVTLSRLQLALTTLYRFLRTRRADSVKRSPMHPFSAQAG